MAGQADGLNDKEDELAIAGLIEKRTGTPTLPDPNFVSIGFGSVVAINRVMAMLTPDTAPVRRLLHDMREKGLLLDATYGRKTKAVLILDTGQVLISALQPETIVGRFNSKNNPR